MTQTHPNRPGKNPNPQARKAPSHMREGRPVVRPVSQPDGARPAARPAVPSWLADPAQPAGQARRSAVQPDALRPVTRADIPRTVSRPAPERPAAQPSRVPAKPTGEAVAPLAAEPSAQSAVESTIVEPVMGVVPEPTTRPTSKRAAKPASGRSAKPAPKRAAASADALAAKPSAAPAAGEGALGPSYLPGLDGLRCIAILAVLLYHIAPNQFVGGYVGVDFFFVISGLLITYSIVRTLRNPSKSFSLKEYALRRLRRLTPSLVLLIAVCVPAAALIYPELLVGGLRQVLGGLTYTTNWVEILHGSNYFDQANPMVFKNLWSVAVEEQFYLIWPPVLVALFSRKRSPRQGLLLGIAGGIALVSAALMFLLVGDANFTRVYYGTDTHCFGIALGIMLAFVWSRESGPFSRSWLMSQKWTLALFPLGLAGFVALVLLSPDTSLFTYPFGLFIASVCSLAMIASVISRPDSLLTRFMELPPMRWLGSRSYGIYLWHWPLLVFGRILVPTAVGTPQSLAVDVAFVALSFAIAELSYRLVETPFRKTGVLQALRDLGDRAADGWAGKIQVAACALLAVATVAALITAPEKTQLQMQIEAMQQQQAQQGQGTGQSGENNADSPDGNGGSEVTVQDPAAQEPEVDTSSIPNYDESQATGIPDGSTVTAIGDSLISGTADGFGAVFPGINFLAEPIRQWDDAVEVVNEGLEQGVIRQNVILDFGTNGGVRDEALVYQVIDALGPGRRIILYNIYSPSEFVGPSNELYARIAEEYPNVYLGDWASVVSEHPEYLQADRTHANMEGMYPFVDVATQAFSQS